MARINIKTNVVAPNEINIPLIRADHAATSNVFRVCFEISLSIFSTLLGYTLGLTEVARIHYVFLVVVAVGMLSFLILTAKFGKQAKVV